MSAPENRRSEARKRVPLLGRTSYPVRFAPWTWEKGRRGMSQQVLPFEIQRKDHDFTPGYQAKPFMLCTSCWYRIGFGYDRIKNHFPISKHQVYSFIRRRTLKFGPIQGRSRLPIRHELIHDLNNPAKEEQRLFKRKQREQRTIEKRRLSKVKVYLRTKIWRWIFKDEHPVSASELAGCSKPDFIDHIYSQFSRGMLWENYGKVWEFDHIVPCSKFNLYDHDERRKCFHFSNYQPKFVSENRHKSALVSPCQPELLIRFHSLKSRSTKNNRKPSVTKQDLYPSNATSKAFVPLENAGVLQTQQRTGLTWQTYPAPVQRESGPILIAL